MTTDPRYPGWKNIGTHDQYMRVVDAERAVIEAAKALYDCYTLEDQSKDFWKTDPVLSPRLASLFFKVEALQEVE